MASMVTDLAKTYVEKLINGAISESRFVCCLASITEEYEEEKVRLEVERTTMRQRAKLAIRRGHDIQDNVLRWEEDVDKLIGEEDNAETKQKCFRGICPDCIWRYKRGRELANKTELIKRMVERGEKLENVGLPSSLPGVERYSSQHYISFKSRVSTYKELLDALKDDCNYIIGLQGMGGIGKTTLAKEVGKELKQCGQFSHVTDTTVSFTPDIKKIQDDIAGPLGLKWGENCNESDRPKKLWSRLTNGEKILVILDDVWDQDPPLDFDAIGIPKQDNQKGCKVLVTTRSKRIFSNMDCVKVIELDLLSEKEAWFMFKRYASISTNGTSKSLIEMGRKIANECKRLPVAIAVIASSLKGQQHRLHEWNATLKSLKKPVSMRGVDEDVVGIYKCLKSSYDNMRDEKAKGLFLLCSLYREDEEISVEVLTRLGIGAGLFGEELRKKLNTLLAQEEAFWKQRAKVLWLKDGDTNSKFFHAMASMRKKQNTIVNLRQEDGSMATGKQAVSAEAKAYFQQLFTAITNDQEQVLTHVKPKVSQEDNRELTRPFSIEEFKQALFQMHNMIRLRGRMVLIQLSLKDSGTCMVWRSLMLGRNG